MPLPRKELNQGGPSPSPSKPQPEVPPPDAASPRSLKVMLKLKVKGDRNDSGGGGGGGGGDSGSRQGQDQDQDQDRDVDSPGQQQSATATTTRRSTPAVETTAIPMSASMSPPAPTSTLQSVSKRKERKIAGAPTPTTAPATKATPGPKTKRKPGPVSKSAPKSKARPRATAIVKATSSTPTPTPTPTLVPRKTKAATPNLNKTATTTPKPKSTVRRHRRGRPRNVSLLAAAAHNARLDNERADRERNAEIASKAETTLRFEFLSDWTFPVLVDVAANDATTETRVEGEGEVEDEAQTGGEIPKTRQCACCGVFKAAAVAPTPTPEAASSSIPDDRQAPPMTLPWANLNLQRTRHVNLDTLSTRDLVITRTGMKPNTLEFWYDMTVAEQAMASEDLDFKMMCLRLIWGRERADFSALEGNVSQNLRVGRGLWDCIVRHGVEKGKMWRKQRRMKEKEREKAAGWAVWEEGVRSRILGGFVEDTRGAWLLRAPGLDGAVRKMLKLGYKRAGTVQEVLIGKTAKAMEERSPPMLSPCADAGFGNQRQVEVARGAKITGAATIHNSVEHLGRGP